MKLPSEYKVVAIGGGHGLAQLLKALSYLESNLTAVVTTTDNGGSSGLIRNSFSTIAWGDIRNCLVSLADPKSNEAQFFSYRFPNTESLSGHVVGNLLLQQYSQITNPLYAIDYFRQKLNVKANVFPMITSDNDLVAVYPNGETTIGEVQIDNNNMLPAAMALLKPASGLKEVTQKIAVADLIVFSPGSFFTSVIPSLLVDDYAKAISVSKAKLVLVNNIAQENSAAGYLTFKQKKQYLERYLHQRKIDVLVENSPLRSISPDTILQPLTDLDTGLHCPSCLNQAISSIH
ncbi:gluconeogenesis factor YvcK family protein [Parashewanella curva]|uniref:gluconeogenesis factor YvcK family protein n=1 Tax=Parashewanella curva TaxID=2338552 RepID=UPI001404CCA9|nr:uridine diphosphate-N-acetylglucosamine-binding protein YvcK [Parashewanella curva]